ncbi:MAG TPA: DUF5994 family protein [Marmoricola sp.]|nr:DUF5994 family protein [Marmoricola sp.]
MTTSKNPARSALRLSLSDPGSPGALDGGWWPQSRDLPTELRDLVDHFPADRGRLTRAIFSPPDWEPCARRVMVRHGYVETLSFPRDDTHVIVLRTSAHTELCLLVVPPDVDEEHAQRALEAAATPRFATSAAKLLEMTSARS